MTVLTTRTLQYKQDDGINADVVLTIFEPVEREPDAWRCIFDFEPPIKPQNVAGFGVDWIQAFIESLVFARLYFETTRWSKTGHWQRMVHLGLPGSTKEMLAHDSKLPHVEARGESFPVLATRTLGIPGESGGVREITLTLYSPFPTEDGSWKCAYSFDPIDVGSIRYGIGADFIEATLDALAGARVVFESMIPAGWTKPDELLDCANFPIKSDRAFYIVRAIRQ